MEEDIKATQSVPRAMDPKKKKSKEINVESF